MQLPEFTPGGSTSWSNNVPDPLMSTDEIPAFTFDLEGEKGKQDGKGSFGKEVTVAELPISKGIAGVSMRLEPGVMRELHWHATAAEWGVRPEWPCAHHDRRPARQPEHRRLRSRGLLVLPAWTSSCAGGARR